MLVIEAPFEPTHLLSMAEQLGSVVLGTAQVSVQDAVVAAASTQVRVVPGHRADATLVAT